MTSLTTFFRKKENWPIVIIPVLLLLWAQFGAPNLGLTTFNSLAYYNSPYRGNTPLASALPERKPNAPLGKRVVLIVIDGLRDATSRHPKLVTFARLRAIGADGVSIVGQPSLSLPGWTVLGTGGWQEQSSFATNFPKNAIDLDTIFMAAHRAGLKTALVGSPEWAQLYGRDIDIIYTPEPPASPDHYKDMDWTINYDTELGKQGIEALKAKADFTLLYFAGPDNASHGYGAVSEQYVQAATHDNDLVAAFLEQIDLKDTTVIITADHGHIDHNWDGGGGHGGWEPEVLRATFIAAGNGIKPGDYGLLTQADIAPTIAALLGAPIPTHNQGDVLVNIIDAPDSVKAPVAVDNAEQIAARYTSMLQIITGDSKAQADAQSLEPAREALKKGDAAGAIRLALQSNQAVRAQWEAARQARVNTDRPLRLLLGLYLLLPVALYAYWWKRAGWHWLTPVVVGAIYLALTPIIYLYVRGLSYSLTMFNTEEIIKKFLTGRVIDALILLAAMMLVVGIWRYKDSPGEVARNAVHTLFVIAVGMMLQILYFYVLWGIRVEMVMPDLQLGFKYYVDVFQTTAFWPMNPLPMAALLPMLAILTAWLTNRVLRLTGRI